MNAKYLGLYVFLCNLVAGVLAAPPSPLPTTTYTTRYLNPFINGSWDFSIQTPIVVSIFGIPLAVQTATQLSWGRGCNTHRIILVTTRRCCSPVLYVYSDDKHSVLDTGISPAGMNIYLVALCIFLPVAAIFYVYITER